jgi:hypothetical protein
VLNLGWWDEAKQHIDDPRVGIIWGVNYDAETTPERAAYLRTLRVDYVKYLVQQFYIRGGMHDTLLKREAIEGIRIPSELHWYEDGYIYRYVTSRGYEARIVYTGCLHYHPPEEEVRREDIKRVAYLAKKYGFEKPSVLKLLKGLLSLAPLVYSSVKTFGFRQGLARAFRRWKANMLFRLYLLTVRTS